MQQVVIWGNINRNVTLLWEKIISQFLEKTFGRVLPSAPIFENQAIQICIIYLILSWYLKTRSFLLHFPKHHLFAYQLLYPSGKLTLETALPFQVHTILLYWALHTHWAYDFWRCFWEIKKMGDKNYKDCSIDDNKKFKSLANTYIEVLWLFPAIFPIYFRIRHKRAALEEPLLLNSFESFKRLRISLLITLTNNSCFGPVQAVSAIRKEFPAHVRWSLFGTAPARAQKPETETVAIHSLFAENIFCHPASVPLSHHPCFEAVSLVSRICCLSPGKVE